MSTTTQNSTDARSSSATLESYTALPEHQTPPSKAGWYWARQNVDEQTVIVEVQEPTLPSHDYMIIRQPNGSRYRSTHKKWEQFTFAGPIPEHDFDDQSAG